MMRSFLRAAPALGLALALSACATTAARAPAPDHPLLVRAEQALLAGDEDQALRCYRAYREGFQPSPHESDCHYWEGVLLLKRGAVAEAERSFREALARPRMQWIAAQAWVGLGDCSLVRDDYAEAVQRYQRGLDLHVPDARNDYALYRMGIARQRLGQWDAGKACYTILVRDHAKSQLAPRAEQRLRWPDACHHLQVGAFQAEDSARQLEQTLHRKGIVAKTVNVVNGPAPWLVWVGDYPSHAAAVAALPQMKALCGSDVVLVP